MSRVDARRSGRGLMIGARGDGDVGSISGQDPCPALGAAGGGFCPHRARHHPVHPQPPPHGRARSPHRRAALSRVDERWAFRDDTRCVFRGFPLLQIVYRHRKRGTLRCRMGRAASTPTPTHKHAFNQTSQGSQFFGSCFDTTDWHIPMPFGRNGNRTVRSIPFLWADRKMRSVGACPCVVICRAEEQAVHIIRLVHRIFVSKIDQLADVAGFEKKIACQPAVAVAPTAQAAQQKAD